MLNFALVPLANFTYAQLPDRQPDGRNRGWLSAKLGPPANTQAKPEVVPNAPK